MDKVQELKVRIKKKLDRKREERKPPYSRLISRIARLQHKLKHAIVLCPDDQITLSSGRKTSVYINCKPVIYSAEGQYLIGHILNQLIADQNIDAIGGPSTGADPIALAASCMSNQYSKQINAFSIRNDAKDHGVDRAFCGFVMFNDNVIIVDDVLTTGQSLQRAITLVEKTDAKIKQIIVLVDRQEGGKEALENLGYRVQSLYTKKQLMS